LLEGSVKKLGTIPVPRLSFFWGMGTIIVSLILLIDQPETWVCMAIAVMVTLLGIVALALVRQGEPGEVT
jgi:hypothetical protein